MKMFKKLLFLFCLYVPLCLLAQPFASEIVLIIIDDTEPSGVTRDGQLKRYEGLGAAGTDLLTALYEEECIIIVSSSVVQYVMRYIKDISSNPFDLHPKPVIKPQNWIKKK